MKCQALLVLGRITQQVAAYATTHSQRELDQELEGDCRVFVIRVYRFKQHQKQKPTTTTTKQ